jgi:hypothetical protein
MDALDDLKVYSLTGLKRLVFRWLLEHYFVASSWVSVTELTTPGLLGTGEFS